MSQDISIEDWDPDPPGAALTANLDALATSPRGRPRRRRRELRRAVFDGRGEDILDREGGTWVRTGTKRVLVARQGGRIVGTVQIDLSVPPNQQHRAEVLKLLVHPAARRQGIARALMIALEGVAQSERRTLLTLDTWTGSAAETLYRSLGYVVVGVIPRYARGSLTPGLEPATIMYKELSATPSSS